MVLYRFLLGFLSLFCLESCNLSPKSQYDSAAEEFCECANPHFDKFSDDFKKDIIEVAQKNKSSEEAMQILLDKRMDKNSTSIAQDAILMQAFSGEMDKCLNKIHEKYARKKPKNSQALVIDTILNSLKQKDHCASLNAAVFLLKPSHIIPEN
jgi:hypothetical protein